MLKKSLASVALSMAVSLTAQAAETLRIGIAGPFSGAVSPYGQMQLQGARAAIEHINQQGGVNGMRLEAVEYDDGCEPKQAVSVANRVVNDGVRYLVGHLCSSSTQPATDIYKDENILVITGSTNPGITSRGYPLVFRTIGLDSEQGETAARYIAEKVKPARVAIIHDKQQYGKGIAMIVNDQLQAAGVNVVTVDGVNSGEKDFSALITKLKRKEIDFVYYGGYHPELALIMRQASAVDFKPGYMGPEGLGNKDIAFLAGDAVEGLLVTLPTRYDLLPRNKPVVEKLKAQGIDPSGPFIWTSYAAVEALADTIARVGADNPADVARVMHSTTIDTAIGELSWDEHGDLNGFPFGVYRWHSDGTGTPAP